MGETCQMLQVPCAKLVPVPSSLLNNGAKVAMREWFWGVEKTGGGCTSEAFDSPLLLVGGQGGRGGRCVVM